MASPPLTRLPDVDSFVATGVLRDPRVSGGPLAAELDGHLRRLEVSSPTAKCNAGPAYYDSSSSSDRGPVQMPGRPNERKKYRNPCGDGEASPHYAGPKRQSGDWYGMLSQLRQPKEAVKPLIFDGKDGASIKEFFAEYELYFGTKYAGNERQQSQMLREFLGGSAQKAYDALDGSRLKYSLLTCELISWYKGEKGNLRGKRESEFRKAKVGSHESLKIYALKLERLASQAFPDSAVQCERELCRKFRKTVPESFRQALHNSERDLPLHMGRRRTKLSWPDMRVLAESEDRHCRQRREEQSSESEGEPDVNVWYSRPEENGRNSSSVGQLDSVSQWGSGKASPLKPKRVTFGRTFKSSSRSSLPPVGNWTKARTENKHLSGRVPQCDWCGRRGHLENLCWTKAGVCLICGSSSHNKDGCPEFNSSRKNFLPTCSICGGNHLGKDCDQSLN